MDNKEYTIGISCIGWRKMFSLIFLIFGMYNALASHLVAREVREDVARVSGAAGVGVGLNTMSPVVSPPSASPSSMLSAGASSMLGGGVAPVRPVHLWWEGKSMMLKVLL